MSALSNAGFDRIVRSNHKWRRELMPERGRRQCKRALHALRGRRGEIAQFRNSPPASIRTLSPEER